MAKGLPSVVVIWPLVVYPLAGIGVMAIYWHYWGKKLGTS